MASAGCSFSVDFAAAGCEGGAGCSDGGVPGGDSGNTGDGAVAEASCGQIGGIAGWGNSASPWYLYGDQTFEISSQIAQVLIPANQMALAGIQSPRAYLFEDTELSMTIDNLAAVAQTGAIGIDVGIMDANWDVTYLSIFDDNVSASQWANGSGSSFGQRAMEPDYHHVRLREHDGLVYLEIAGDGDFVTVATRPTVEVIAPVYLYFDVWSSASITEDITIQSSRLNDGAAASPRCSAGSITDDFEGPSLAAQWLSWSVDDSCSVSQQDGTLRMVNDASSCGIHTRRGFDLTQAPVSIRLDKVNASGVSLDFQVDPVDGNPIGIHIHNSPRAIAAVHDGSHIHSEPYGEDMQYLRLRAEGSVMHFETSVSGTSWSALTSIAVAEDLSDVEIELFTGEGQLGAPSVGFDDLNRLP